MTHLYLSFGTKTLRGECCPQLECGFSDAAGLSFVTVTYFHFNQCVIVHFLAFNYNALRCLVTLYLEMVAAATSKHSVAHQEKALWTIGLLLHCAFLCFWHLRSVRDCAYCSKPSWSFSPVDVSLSLSFTVIMASPFISSAVLCIFKMQTIFWITIISTCDFNVLFFSI